MEDPFFIVRGEVNKALGNVNEQYKKWEKLLHDENSLGKEEYNSTVSEIKNGIRSIEWDLEDLTETVNIVESNPMKFNLTPNDIIERRDFINDTKNRVKSMKKRFDDPQVLFKLEKSQRSSLIRNGHVNKYEKLDNEMVQSNQRYIEDTQAQQQMLINQQENQLEHVHRSVGVLKSMGGQINNELEEQAIIIDELTHEVEQTDSRLQTVLVRVEKMLRLADDRKQTYVLVTLIFMMVIVVILFIAL
ncbi:syntaxin-6-like [Clytia hemisphaerica]|uniref:syntaxin-6-like n=1 Tax=Clytia hemisphaerica TaxID=252671 RepID=UPI0034D3E6E4